MSKITGYETFCLYLALKNHFTLDSYNYFKYNGKTKNVSKEAFLSRRDRFQFEKLARSCDNVQDHLVANLLKDKTWVGDLLDDEAFDNTKAYVKINQSMSYTFRNELDKIGDIKPALRFDGQYPNIISFVMNGTISYQTFVILNYFIQFVPKFDAKMPDDFIWSKLSTKVKKFAPFIITQIDKKKFAGLLKSHVENTIYLTGRDCPAII